MKKIFFLLISVLTIASAFSQVVLINGQPIQVATTAEAKSGDTWYKYTQAQYDALLQATKDTVRAEIVALPGAGSGIGDFFKDGSVSMTGNLDVADNSITIDGATSGTATITAAAVAGTPTLTLPTTTLEMDQLITDVDANSAKTSNATHTGEVTGATALTIASGVVDSDNITNLTIVAGDIAPDAITEPKLASFNAPTDGYHLGYSSVNGIQWEVDAGGSGIPLHPLSDQQIDSIYVGTAAQIAARSMPATILAFATDETFQLTDLIDVNTATITNKFFLVADGVDFESRAITNADFTVTSELDLAANSIGATAQSATGDGTTTIDWGNGNFFHFQFGAFNETFTFTAPTKPGTFILKLIQDSTGSRTATWPGTVEWPGGSAATLTTTATTGTDIITFYYDGTNYFAVSSLDFQ